MHQAFDANGYVVVPDVMPDLARSIVAELPQDARAAREFDWDGSRFLGDDDPPQVLRSGPHPIPALNDLCLDHRVLDIAETLLRQSPMLAQWQLWVRYPGDGYRDQRLHVDYMNHTLVMPDTRVGFRYVEMIVYLTDIGPEDAPTYVVDSSAARSLPFVPYQIQADEHPEIYALEKPVLTSAGSLLAFGPGTWHRGSAFNATERCRVAVHLAFRTASASWNGFSIMHERAYSRQFVELVGRLDGRQCVALGFPPPGSPYWNSATLAALAQRYPTMDHDLFAKAVTDDGGARSGG
jgi:hypothetical protein